MIAAWIEEIKKTTDPDKLGMIIAHNGIVRATAKDGKAVRAMKLSYNKDKLNTCVNELKGREGIAAIKVWINEGMLNIGDDIMRLVVAGRFRTDVLPVLQELLAFIKNHIVHEEEIYN
jgi:molybdopterin synthase catalytic subunit